jgi:hypothetical protein
MSGDMGWHSLAAQCVMCFRTAAAQQAERSRVLNSGILILLVPPIVVLAGILIMAFRKAHQKRIAGTASVRRSHWLYRAEHIGWRTRQASSDIIADDPE